ncbi:hypothetical protein [Streptomyces sp. WMMB 322]|uniref:hypothetical protein n=1 Tax=Streptomyces sp. WMMB 322 TaxID=1286821 RepID=UPI0006E1988A|nr:hypothetical protein [Streptomyces sp. WMMB 322]SCK08508.1 hypothetical protein H180DRAFT_00378 [Streptomyces sp. WMMB 322]
MSDYFDRLLARHASLPRAGGPAGKPGAGEVPRDGRTAPDDAAPDMRRVRVRPRLPGPFERVEALRDRDDGDDGLSPAGPQVPAPRPARTDEGPAPRGVREIHTERHTVVRETSTAPETGERQQAQHSPGRALLRPVPSRAPRPAASVPVQPAGRGASRDAGPAGTGTPQTGAAPALVARSGEVVARSAAARPGSGDLSAARSARQQAAAGRRGGARPAERVVHVQIGRLEVSAATPPGAGRGGAGEPGRQQTGRTAPTVSLETYLARGRNGERSN